MCHVFYLFIYCYHQVTAAKKDWEVLIGKFLLHESNCQYPLNLHVLYDEKNPTERFYFLKSR